MPSYPIPPWLRPPPDPGQQYLQAFGEGANIAHMQAAAQQNAQQASMQQARFEREYLMKQQEMEIAKQQHALEFGLKQKQLQEETALNQARIREASQMYAARQQYADLVKGGMDPIKASMQVGPALFPSAAGFGTLARASQGTPGLRPDQRIRFLLQQQKILGNTATPQDWAEAKGQMQSGESQVQAANRIHKEKMDKMQKQIDDAMQGVSQQYQQPQGYVDPETGEWIDEGGPRQNTAPQATVPQSAQPQNNIRITGIKRTGD